MVQVLPKGGLQVKITKTTLAVFPRGSKNRESNNDNKHDHGQGEGEPQHYVEVYICIHITAICLLFANHAIGTSITRTCNNKTIKQ